MTKDPIVEEVRATREKLFDACDGDLGAFLKRLKEQEQQDQSRIVSRKTEKDEQERDVASGGRPRTTGGPEPARTPR